MSSFYDESHALDNISWGIVDAYISIMIKKYLKHATLKSCVGWLTDTSLIVVHSYFYDSFRF